MEYGIYRITIIIIIMNIILSNKYLTGSLRVERVLYIQRQTTARSLESFLQPRKQLTIPPVDPRIIQAESHYLCI